MHDVVIHAEGLSKRYAIGGRAARYQTLRETITRAAAAPFRRAASFFGGTRAAEERRHIWALDDATFEVRRGEVVGVIGSNGAGKSTLLKIMSRITEPTRGFVDIRGRVGSLLEVGTGFHYELTGRENIYLNGAILGMRHAEVTRKLDEIVAFAEIETFLDTPVKHYSSGMFLRLAFSVAAHLEPEILLVDEVLAVGDVRFQKKCLGKMNDVAAHGRTVMLVSHNLGAIRELCHTSLVLDRGRIAFRGPVVDGLAHYSRTIVGEGGEARAGTTSWRHVRVNGEAETGSVTVASGENMEVDAWLDLAEEYTGVQLVCLLVDAVGGRVVAQQVDSRDGWAAPLVAGPQLVRVEVPALWLRPSVYTLYFKFFGQRRSGVHDRCVSPHTIVDVVGEVDCLPGTSLAPPLRWSVCAASGAATTAAAGKV